jgi:GTP-binding protein YchF
MKLGIIGLPQSGKTTVFNAFTRGDQPTTVSGGRFTVQQAVVDVPDARVDRLAGLFQPRKITYAKVTYADIAGLEGGGRNGGFSGPLLNQLSQMDGFIHVVRGFENALVPHPAGSIDPLRDLQAVNNELLLNDLILVERKLERLAEELRKGGGREKALVQQEIKLFERLQEALGDEQPLRELEFSAVEIKALSGYGFLTQRPMLVVLNQSEDQSPEDVPTGLLYDRPGTALVALQGRLEMELAQLPPEEAAPFMEDYGLQVLSLERVIRQSFELLNLLTFYTVGEDEVRAWTVTRGANALQAAAAIHTDLAKGFIRAEVIEAELLLALGGLAEARQKGRLRLEGKDYLVKDGEIVHIRFNL